MRRTAAILLVLLLCAGSLAACSATAEELTGQAQGYGGPLTVMVSMNGDRIADVRVTEHSETDGVGTRAIETLPAAIVEAGSTEVDSVSGATVTSEAIKAAVEDALQKGGSIPTAAPMTDGPFPEGVRAGVGMCATGRIGPGKDAEGKQIYSFNVATAAGVFDGEGRILSLALDQLEVLSPNADSEGTPLFSGFPAQTGDEDRFMSEVAAWVTKGMRGDSYMLASGSWRDQATAYEQLFTGMTVDEIETWFALNCSDETGRPLRPDAGSEADQTKYAELAGEAQELLDDVTTSATMSLRDAHGDLLSAIRRAWEDAQHAENMTVRN